MKIAVVVPTYNEKENVATLTESILSQNQKTKVHELHVVIADSCSPDGTGDAVREIMAKNKKVHLVEDKRRGIGIGLLTGDDYSFDNLKADAVINMDADFSHDPNDIPRLIREFDKGSSVVIGSRYMRGGGTKNWGLVRKVGSQLVNLYIRIMLGLQPTEITTNFRLYGKDVWKKLDKDSVPWTEKSFLTTPALLYYILKAEPKFSEIPILFVDRTRGYSKAQLIPYAISIFKFSLKERRQTILTFIRFLCIGLTGVLVNLSVLHFLISALNWSENVSSPVAVEFSVLSNFILNNFWTFRGRDVEHGLLIRLLRYNVLSLGGMGVNFMVFVFFRSVFDFHYLLAQFLGIAAATPITFLASMKWAWRRK